MKENATSMATLKTQSKDKQTTKTKQPLEKRMVKETQ